jgi:hypothetical protein
MKIHMDAAQIKAILDQVTTVYNNKVKEEKEQDTKKGGKKNNKPALKGTKVSTNQMMLGQMMGGDNDFGDNLDSDDDENDVTKPAKGKKLVVKVEEVEQDFM